MEWFPASTDINPFENLWFIIKRVGLLELEIFKQRKSLVTNKKKKNAENNLQVKTVKH